jgi:predicted amidohydrolase
MGDGATVKIAGVQMEPRLLDRERNLQRCLDFARTAAAEGARLIVFPECALTGYVFHSLEEAMPAFEPIPGPSTERIAGACRELNVHVVLGLLEADGDRHYNAAVLIGPEGLAGTYRKVHLPYLGIDRFLDGGDSAPVVFDTDIARIGIGICYDAMFPEHARVLALQGADILALPTNWPQRRESIPEHVIPARAMENRIFVAAVNRVGRERGTRFIGHSVIAHCAQGAALAAGGPDEETIIYAEIDPALARQKRVVIARGEFEFDVLRDRRPGLYGAIVRPVLPE